MVSTLLLLPFLIGTQAAPLSPSDSSVDGFLCRMNPNWCVEAIVAGVTTRKADWQAVLDNVICSLVPAICDDEDDVEEEVEQEITIVPSTTVVPTLPSSTKKPRVKPYVSPSAQKMGTDTAKF